MKVYVVVTTVRGETHGVDVFWERWKAASMAMRTVKELNAKSKNPDPVVWTDEDDSLVYRAKAGDIVSQVFARDV